VQGLPLSASTVYYYDIFASQLAALSTSKNNRCPEALEIASIIEGSEYIQDPNIAADMVVVRNICAFSTTTSATNVTATPEAEMMDVTPTATP
jgi:hypothetical protein